MTSDITASLTSASAVVIYLPAEPPLAMVAAGLSVYLSLKSRGTSVDIVCPTPMTVAESRLVGVDQVKTESPGRNLIISFDYVKDAIEKVSYNVEEGKFNLLVQPKAGHQPLSADNVSFKLGAAGADLAILIGNASLPTGSQNLPSLSLVKNDSRSLSVETATLLESANLPIDKDIATNLLWGLAEETDRFSTAAADDFAAAANLARRGGSLNQAAIYSAVQSKPEPKPAAGQWTGPKIFHSGDVI